MSPVLTVGVLHPGQMGAAIAAQVASNGHTVLWCPAGRSDATAHRAHHAGLRLVPQLRDLLEQSQIVLSICPPASAEQLAAEVAGGDFHGVYVDANAISPDRMHRITDLLSDTGATVVDGSIIGPPPGGEATARLYLAGRAADTDRVAELLIGTRAKPVYLGDDLGRASALKMAFASYQKAHRTLAALAHALADDHDVTEALLTEARRMPGDALADRDYLSSVAARAWRWAPEMREVADTLTARHLPPDLALATAEVLQHWAEAATDQTTDPATTLQHLHDRQETDTWSHIAVLTARGLLYGSMWLRAEARAPVSGRAG